jgi:DNA (cytosine-5)-methyltransferase 1
MRDRTFDTYKQLLDEAWEQHLEPVPDGAPTVVSTFAGCGGSSLGYSMAGFKELLAVEWDEGAMADLTHNLKHVTPFCGDISDLSVDKALDLAGVEPGQLDVFDGSPPCQGFSTAGRRVLDDPRNSLFREFVRLLKGFNPRALIMENVAGMVRGKMRLVFKEILQELRDAGYVLQVRLLNAQWYDVPQMRQRVIFVGLRTDVAEELGVIGPDGQAAPTAAMAPYGFHPRVSRKIWTTGEALVDCPTWLELWPKKGICVEKYLRNIKPGQTKQDYTRGGSGFSMLRIRNGKPANTILASCTRHGYDGLIHPTEPRKLSGGEVKRLSSFPDQYEFLTDTFEGAWKRCGNCVPPLLMRAIAHHLRTDVLGM